MSDEMKERLLISIPFSIITCFIVLLMLERIFTFNPQPIWFLLVISIASSLIGSLIAEALRYLRDH